MLKRFRPTISVFLILSAVYVMFPPRTYAYLDPGTGSYVLQVLLAAFLAGALTLKMYWKRIRVFVKGLFSKEKKHHEQERD